MDTTTILGYAYTVGGSLLGLALVLVLVRRTVFSTPQNNRTLVTNFGKFVRVQHPGIGFKNPIYGGRSKPFSLQVQQLPVPESGYTSTGNSVTIVAQVQYQVGSDDQSVQNAYYLLTDPAGQIQSHVSSVIRNTLPTMTLDEVMKSQGKIRAAVKDELTETMGKYGYVITDVLITKADPDKKIVDSNNEKLAAENAKVTATNLAEAQRIKIVRAAEAQKDAAKLNGEGVALERNAIFAGLRDMVKELESVVGTDAQQALLVTMFMQYLESLKALAGSPNSKIIAFPLGAQTPAELMGQMGLNLSALEASKSKTGSSRDGGSQASTPTESEKTD